MTDINEFLNGLPSGERVITRRLRSIILDSDPRMKEHFAYGVPYYSKKRRVCFIWPASAPQGPRDSKVTLGLCYGHMLSNSRGILKMEGRTQVATVRFLSVNEIDEHLISEVLQEALLVDNLKLQRKKLLKNG